MINPIGIISMFYARPFVAEHLHLFKRMKKSGMDFVELLVPEQGELDLSATRRALEEAQLSVVLAARVNLSRDLASDDPNSHLAGVCYLEYCAEVAVALGATLVGGPLYGAPLVFAGRAPAPVAEADRLARVDRVVSGLRAAGSMNMEEGDLAEAILRSGSRLFHFQANENHRGFVGSGHLDWPDIARALVRVGYRGPITLEPFRRQEQRLGVPLAQWRVPVENEDQALSDSAAYLRTALAFATQGAA